MCSLVCILLACIRSGLAIIVNINYTTTVIVKRVMNSIIVSVSWECIEVVFNAIIVNIIITGITKAIVV